MNDAKRRCGEPAARGRCTFNGTELKQLLGVGARIQRWRCAEHSRPATHRTGEAGDAGAEVSESWFEGELRAALDEVYRAARWLLSNSMAAVRREQPRQLAWVWLAGVVASLLTVSSVAVFVSMGPAHTQHTSPAAPANAALPQPIPQPITRTSAGAQVAWLWMRSPGQQPSLIGVDPQGRQAARLGQSTVPGMAGVYGVWRSADGSTVFTVGSDQVTAYSALDGKVERTYSRPPGAIVGDAFSSDGRWLAILSLESDLELQLIDLWNGSSQVAPVGHDPNAKLPGMSCSGGCAGKVIWGMPVFGPDSAHLYTLTDWGGPLHISSFSNDGGKLAQAAAAVDGQQGRSFPACAGPAMAAKVIAGGQTLVAFCHFDGAVWFFDLRTLNNAGVVQSHQGTPFWLSPIFTPDGQLLYLHQWPGFGDMMQVVDLANRRLLGPVPTPTKPDHGGPFAGLMTHAYAGFVASTVPVSPDGLKLYSATDDGVMVLRIPDLKPIAKLAAGLKASEVWISGDGQTIYATADDSKHLVVMRADGSEQKSVTLPSAGGRFIASEHG